MIFIAEVMIGGPQGRYDMGVDIDTVDFSAPLTPPGADEEEYSISRNFAYFARTIRNARSAIDVYRVIKKEQEWTTHPMLSSLNPVFPPPPTLIINLAIPKSETTAVMSSLRRTLLGFRSQ